MGFRCFYYPRHLLVSPVLVGRLVCTNRLNTPYRQLAYIPNRNPHTATHLQAKPGLWAYSIYVVGVVCIATLLICFLKLTRTVFQRVCDNSIYRFLTGFGTATGYNCNRFPIPCWGRLILALNVLLFATQSISHTQSTPRQENALGLRMGFPLTRRS